MAESRASSAVNNVSSGKRGSGAGLRSNLGMSPCLPVTIGKHDARATSISLFQSLRCRHHQHHPREYEAHASVTLGIMGRRGSTKFNRFPSVLLLTLSPVLVLRKPVLLLVHVRLLHRPPDIGSVWESYCHRDIYVTYSREEGKARGIARVFRSLHIAIHRRCWMLLVTPVI